MTKPHIELANDIMHEIRQRLDGLDDKILDDLADIVIDNIIAFEKRVVENK